MRLLIDIGNTRAKWALCSHQGDIVVKGVLGAAALFDDASQIQ